MHNMGVEESISRAYIPKMGTTVICPFYGHICPLNSFCDSDPNAGRPITECPYTNERTRN